MGLKTDLCDRWLPRLFVKLYERAKTGYTDAEFNNPVDLQTFHHQSSHLVTQRQLLQVRSQKPIV